MLVAVSRISAGAILSAISSSTTSAVAGVLTVVSQPSASSVPWDLGFLRTFEILGPFFISQKFLIFAKHDKIKKDSRLKISFWLRLKTVEF